MNLVAKLNNSGQFFCTWTLFHDTLAAIRIVVGSWKNEIKKKITAYQKTNVTLKRNDEQIVIQTNKRDYTVVIKQINISKEISMKWVILLKNCYVDAFIINT